MLKLNNKGFTLVELLAVIVILAVLIGIAVPTYMNVSASVKKNQYNSKIEAIKVNALKYANDIGISDASTISIQTLIDTGYIATDNDNNEIINPVDNSLMNNYLVIYSMNDNELNVDIVANNDDIDTTTYSSDITIMANNLAINNNVTEWSKDNINLTAVADSSKYNATACSYTLGGVTQDASYNNSTCTVNITTSLYLNAKVVINFTTDKGLISKGVVVRIDKEAPTVNGIVEQTWEAGATEKNVTITASDGTGSGIKNIYIGSTNDINQATVLEDEDNDNIVTIKKNMGTYYLFAMDNVGNYVSKLFNVNNIDTKGPRIELTADGTKTSETNEWYVSDEVKVTLKLIDQVINGDSIMDGGVGIDDSSLKVYINDKLTTLEKKSSGLYTIVLKENNVYTFKISVNDVAGNSSGETKMVIKKDSQVPILKVKYNPIYLTGTIDEKSVINQFNITIGPSGINYDTVSCNPKTIPVYGSASVSCSVSSYAGLTGSNDANNVLSIHYYYAASSYSTTINKVRNICQAGEWGCFKDWFNNRCDQHGKYSSSGEQCYAKKGFPNGDGTNRYSDECYNWCTTSTVTTYYCNVCSLSGTNCYC